MRTFAKILRALIDQQTGLLNRMNAERSVELMTRDQRAARKQEAVCKKQRKLIEKKDRKIASQKEALMRAAQERRDMSYLSAKNAANPIWFEAHASDSVKKTLAYHTEFSKRTWAMFEKAAVEKTVVLLGGYSGAYERFYDRYGKGSEILIDTAGESWASIQEYLECIGTADKVMLLLDKDWKMTAYSLVLMGCKMEDIFVYSLMGYEGYEDAMLHTTWEELKTAARDTQLVLVTANERAEEFVDQFGKEFNVSGVLSAKKKEWGQAFNGLEIVPVKDAVSAYPPEKTTLLLCSVNWNEYANLFAGWGYERIYSLRLLCRSEKNLNSQYSRAFAGVMGMCGQLPCTGEYRLGEIEKLKPLLADEDSVITLENLLRYRETRADRHAFIAEDRVDTLDPLYFERSFISLSDKEIYMDIGIGDGRTIKDFIRRVHGRFRKIYGWEIEPGYVQKAKEAFSYERIEILPYGAWDEDVTMHLKSAGMASSVGGQGEDEVQCRRIDDVCRGPVTFIKMDIEGAEMKALLGARETIKRYRPKLAISLYHRQDDIWQIPLLIHELVPEYRLYIRHHKATTNDTVLYAVI